MKPEELKVILQRMLSNGVKITARSVIREADCMLKNPSDITRQPMRRAVLDEYQARQQEIMALVEKTDSHSRTNLQQRLAQLSQEYQELRGERDLLIASHKAMLLAVGELGGIAVWRKFFQDWELTRAKLIELRALPSAEIYSGPSPKKLKDE